MQCSEAFIYAAMVKKLKPFRTLHGRTEVSTSNPKLTALQVELAKVESEIEALIDTLTGANLVLLSYVNSKIEELDSRKQELAKEIADLSAESVSPKQIQQISGYLDSWEDVTFDDKRHVLDLMISLIYSTSEMIDIILKF